MSALTSASVRLFSNMADVIRRDFSSLCLRDKAIKIDENSCFLIRRNNRKSYNSVETIGRHLSGKCVKACELQGMGLDVGWLAQIWNTFL